MENVFQPGDWRAFSADENSMEIKENDEKVRFVTKDV